MNREKIIQRLKVLRSNRSIKTVAKEVGITESALCNYESGARIPTDETKQRLAAYYGVSVQELFYDD